MLKNIKLLIAYDGTNYHGWQKQRDVVTVQETIENAIYTITGNQAELIGSGRTDANVHAIGQVANFITDCKIPADRIMLALNTKLPNDIRIRLSEEVDMDFSSRFSSKEKTYLYQIYNHRISNPFYDRYTWHVPYALDTDKMSNALRLIEGEHDFKAFMSTNSNVKSTIRHIYSTDIKKENSMIKIEITGNGFLYNMVRIIVGTIVEIGVGRRNESCIQAALLSGQRELLGMTANPQGLFLKGVKY